MYARILHRFFIVTPRIVIAIALSRHRYNNPRNSEELCALFIDSDPFFVKLGQWLSQQRHLHTVHFCDGLGVMRTRAPHHPFEHTKRTVEIALKDTLVGLASTPIASGSIAQVHRGTMHGQNVAVKILHPGIADQLMVDAEYFLFWTSVFNYLPLGPVSSLRFNTLVDMLRSQCDMEQEGENLERFRSHFADHPLVRFPEVVWKSKDVLVMSYEGGDHFDAFQTKYPDHVHYAKQVAKTWL